MKQKNKVENILLIMFLIVLLTAGTFWFIHSIKNVDTDTTVVAETIDFSSKQIIVTSDSEPENTYNAISITKSYGGKYVLKYETEEETKNAYNKLKYDEKLENVYVDSVMELLDIKLSTIKYEGNNYSLESWGTYAMGLNETQDLINTKIKNNKETEDVVVAVIDTGFNLDNTKVIEEELLDRIDENYINITNGEKNIEDNNEIYHGTNVAGIILDATPDNVKILPIKAADAQGDLYLIYICEAITYATEQNVDIINLSFEADIGNQDQKNELNSVIQEAIDKGIIVIAAVGNGNESGIAISSDNVYPAAFKNVIGVGALKTDLIEYVEDNSISGEIYANAKESERKNLSIAKFSNFGSAVDFTAPGENILSLTNNDEIHFMSGTSQASPHIAAAAATIKSYNKEWDTDDVYEILKYYSLDLGDNR